MRNGITFLRSIAEVEYRLTVYRRGMAQNITYVEKSYRLMRKAIRGLAPDDYWTLYKAGPLCLPEREIDKGQIETKKDKPLNLQENETI